MVIVFEDVFENTHAILLALFMVVSEKSTIFEEGLGHDALRSFVTLLFISSVWAESGVEHYRDGRHLKIGDLLDAFDF